MGRLFGLVGGVVAFFVASGATQNFLSIKKNLRDETSQVSEEPKQKGQLPGNLQRAIDQSNADLQRKILAVQTNANNHTAIRKQMFESIRGDKRILRDSPLISKRKPPKRKRLKQSVRKGSVESNPYLD